MDKLNILWITTDKDTIYNMLTMYAIKSKTNKWWEHVNVILWGASVKLVGNDKQIQTEIMEMKSHGITIEACKDCAENFEVSQTLEKLGVDVKYLGEPFTQSLKSDERVITI